MHPILRMVKFISKMYKVKFELSRTPHDSCGSFSEYGRLMRLHTQILRPKGRRKGKPRVYRQNQSTLLLTALHEMTHMLQYIRRDPNWTICNKSGQRIDLVVYDALYGDAWDKANIWQSALAIATLEYEAEITSIRLMNLFGEKYPRSRSVKYGKAYAYSYLVFAKTGIMANPKMYPKWMPYISSSLSFDLSNTNLRKMCDIARANPKLTYTVWKDGKCDKSVW